MSFETRTTNWLAKRVGVELGIDVGGIRIPRDAEDTHLCLLGDSGCGKSSLLRWLLYQIRMRGEPCILYDPEREFLPHFWRPGDVVLNPLDTRMPWWSPGFEVQSAFDGEGFAESLIPDPPGDRERFWSDAARALLIGIIRRVKPGDPSAVAKACQLPLEELATLLKGDPAANAISPKAATMAEGVKGTLMVATRGLTLLPEVPAGAPVWTAKGWAAKPRGWVFVTSTEEARVATLPLLTAWLDSLVRKLLDSSMHDKTPCWFVCDEVQTLKRLSVLKDAFTRGRKRGIRVVIGTQSVSEMELLYGKSASTLLSQPSTKVIYRCSEPALSEWASKLIGQCERSSQRANLRADLTTKGRDSVTLNDYQRIDSLVLPAQIAALPNHRAFFLHRGMVTRIRPRYTRALNLEEGEIRRPVRGVRRKDFGDE